MYVDYFVALRVSVINCGRGGCFWGWQWSCRCMASLLHAAVSEAMPFISSETSAESGCACCYPQLRAPLERHQPAVPRPLPTAARQRQAPRPLRLRLRRRRARCPACPPRPATCCPPAPPGSAGSVCTTLSASAARSSSTQGLHYASFLCSCIAL